MALKVKVYQVRCGDCISIEINDSDFRKSIIIDSGYSITYNKTLKKAIEELKPIDYFIITHTDQDHISGMIPFIKDYIDIPVKKILFNYSPFKIYQGDFVDKSPLQGLNLRDYLSKKNLLEKKAILMGDEYKLSENTMIKIISPSESTLEKYQKEEIVVDNFVNKTSRNNDYSKNISSLLINGYEDKEPSNGSSIAFILKHQNRNFMFLGDAIPSVVCKGIRNLGYSNNNKLKLEFCKLSHHGSQMNISTEFLDLITCENYIISTDGSKHNLPNKSTFSIILNQRHPENTNFIFNYDNNILRSIFNEADFSEYQITLKYPKSNQNFFELNIV